VAAQVYTRGVDRFRVDGLITCDDRFGKHGFGRQVQGFGGECGVAAQAIVEHAPAGRDKGFRNPAGACAPRRNARKQDSCRQTLPGFPAVEGIGIVRHQVREFSVGLLELQLHRGGEIAQQRGNGHGGYVFKHIGLRGFGERQHARGAGRLGFTGEFQGRIAAIRQHQPERDGNMQRAVDDRLPRFAQTLFIRGRREALRQGQGVAPGRCIPRALGVQMRGAGARVPAAKLREINARRILHRRDEILAGHGLAVVAFKVQIHAVPEAVAPQ